jgi:hypothetical protein
MKFLLSVPGNPAQIPGLLAYHLLVVFGAAARCEYRWRGNSVEAT